MSASPDRKKNVEEWMSEIERIGGEIALLDSQIQALNVEVEQIAVPVWGAVTRELAENDGGKWGGLAAGDKVIEALVREVLWTNTRWLEINLEQSTLQDKRNALGVEIEKLRWELLKALIEMASTWMPLDLFEKCIPMLGRRGIA